jgi:hypothetical protein
MRMLLDDREVKGRQNNEAQRVGVEFNVDPTNEFKSQNIWPRLKSIDAGPVTKAREQCDFTHSPHYFHWHPWDRSSRRDAL